MLLVCLAVEVRPRLVVVELGFDVPFKINAEVLGEGKTGVCCVFKFLVIVAMNSDVTHKLEYEF